MKGWYFSGEDKKLRYGDNRKIKLGVTHKIKGEPVLCERGLHASKSIMDALDYSPGTIVWKVELSGKIIEGDNKSVATKRIYLEGGIDITNILRKFARMCALDVIHLWEAPKVVIDYLKTGKEELRDAAWDAAWAAAWAAARATRDAAWAAAWAAARAAGDAGDAARAAAWEAVWDAAWEKQEKRLKRMVDRAIKKG